MIATMPTMPPSGAMGGKTWVTSATTAAKPNSAYTTRVIEISAGEGPPLAPDGTAGSVTSPPLFSTPATPPVVLHAPRAAVQSYNTRSAPHPTGDPYDNRTIRAQSRRTGQGFFRRACGSGDVAQAGREG